MNPIKAMPSIKEVMSVQKAETPTNQPTDGTLPSSGAGEDSASQSVHDVPMATTVRENPAPQTEKEAPMPTVAAETPAPASVNATQSSSVAIDKAPAYPGEFDDIEYEDPVSDDVDHDDDDDEDDDEEVVETPAPVAEEHVEDKGPNFATCWNELFETMFAKNHLIYFSLKDEVPKYEDDIIYIEVKNNIQKEQFETNKRAILEFWRNHFTLNVDDIVITANENKEIKKVIINSEDKMRNMIEQNASLPEFLNILGFHLKE